MISYSNTVNEICESGVDTVIIPVGSIEQHSSHLPIGTDYYLSKSLSEAIAERMEALLLPPLPISTCYEHKGKKASSICMRPITFYQMLQDIVICLYQQGFKKVVLVLGHGGIFIAGPAVRELNAMYPDLHVIISQAENVDMQGVTETKGEIHAGERETSMMMHLHGDLVKTDLMKDNDYLPDCPQSYLNYTTVLRVSKTGAWGEPSYATAEKGKLLFEHSVDGHVECIRKTFAYLEEKNK